MITQELDENLLECAYEINVCMIFSDCQIWNKIQLFCGDTHVC